MNSLNSCCPYRNPGLEDLLRDYFTLSKATSTNRLQVKQNMVNGRRFFEFSIGDRSTALGWVAQTIARNFNKLAGYALADRISVIEHIKTMNTEMFITINEIEAILKTNQRLRIFKDIESSLTNIKNHLEASLIGIKELEKAYSGETDFSYFGLMGIKEQEKAYPEETDLSYAISDVKHQIQEMCSSSTIGRLHEDLKRRELELGKRVADEIEKEREAFEEQEKRIQEDIHKLSKGCAREPVDSSYSR